MKFKNINKLFVLLFFAVIFLPLIFTDFRSESVSMLDNRILAKDPFSAADNGEEFTSAVENYFNDRIGFRKQFLSLSSMIDYYLFRESPNERVILGDRGWLFYNSDAAQDGHTVDMYLGDFRYSDEQLQQIASNLTSAADYLNSNNCEFILYIAPNKERVYSENMPSNYRDAERLENSATVQLISYLQENTGICVVWPYPAIREYIDNHPDRTVYYKTDTHWNHLGAYIGAKALLDELGISVPSPDEISFSEEECQPGDLYNFLALDRLIMDDSDYNPENLPHAPQKSDVDDQSHWEYRNSGRDSRNILVVRDSFSYAMRDYLGSEFNRVDFYKKSNFSQKLVHEKSPDVFVLQLVERNDDLLLNFSLEN